MTKYYVLAEKRINSNTAEHGYGDYPEYITFVYLTVEADTERKAMNAAKRINKNLCFSGINAQRIYSHEKMMSERHLAKLIA